MMSSTSTILAVGAAGKFAGLVVPALAERGAKVRGLVWDAGQGEAVRKSGATEIAIGDLRDRARLDSALKDIDAVFYIAPAFCPMRLRSVKAWSIRLSGPVCAVLSSRRATAKRC